MKTRVLLIIMMSLILTIPTAYLMWLEFGMVCNNAVSAHLQKHSNLFDENTTHETYGINGIGFPFGVHPGNIKECVDFVFKQRSFVEIDNEN